MFSKETAINVPECKSVAIKGAPGKCFASGSVSLLLAIALMTMLTHSGRIYNLADERASLTIFVALAAISLFMF